MMQRMKKIKIQSDKIAMLAEIQQKNAKKEEEKVPAVKKTVDVLKDLSGKKVQKSSKSSNSAKKSSNKRMKFTEEVKDDKS